MNFHEIKLITSLTTSKYFSVDADSIRYPEQVYTPGRTVDSQRESVSDKGICKFCKAKRCIQLSNTGGRLFPRRDEILIVHHYRRTSRNTNMWMEEGWKEWSA